MDRHRPAVSRAVQLAGRGLLLVPLLFLILFFFYPLATIFSVSLAPEGTLDLSGLGALATFNDILWFTIGQALLSTFLTLVLALGTAFVFVRFEFPGKALLLSLSTLAFVLPTVVVAAAFKALIGERGLVNQALMSVLQLEAPPIQLERTLTLILIVHVFYNFAVALRLLTSFWANQSPRMEEAARVLGAHGWRLWWEIRLPVLRPAILASSVLVFIFTFTSFGVIIILGGPQYATLEVEIYQQAVNLFNLPVAAGLSLAQIGLMFAMMIVYTRLQRQIPLDLQSTRQVARPPRTRHERWLVRGTVVVMLVLLFAPLGALAIRSVMGTEGFTLRYYQELGMNARRSVLFVPPIQSIGNSLAFALATTVMAVTLGMLTAYLLGRNPTRWARWLDPVFMLPLATSAVTLGFGFILALDEPPLNLRTSPVLIPIAHTLVAMPFVVRSVLPALHSIPASLLDSGRTLGAAPWQVWRWIELPLISRGVLVGATFAFTISMGEFGASLFVVRPNTPTMPVVIFRLLSQPGALNLGQAMAMSTLLMAVCAVSFIAIERLRTAGVGEF
ncbi:MAG: iron ABC transporter permease [Anaerolineae bacterium]|nr:iron ABC transporter permease [Anaerolineae bacterium]